MSNNYGLYFAVLGVPHHVYTQETQKIKTFSVQVVEKAKTRKQRIVKSLGSAHPDDTVSLEKLMRSASPFYSRWKGQPDRICTQKRKSLHGSLSNSQVQVAGPELVLGTPYDRIGYVGHSNLSKICTQSPTRHLHPSRQNSPYRA